MDDDSIVKSIGMGNTERLSSLNGLRQMPKDQEDDTTPNILAQQSSKKVPILTKLFIRGFHMNKY